MAVSDEIKLAYRGVFFLVLIGVIFIILGHIFTGCKSEFMNIFAGNKENWINYQRDFTNEIRTGIDNGNDVTDPNNRNDSAPGFYSRPIYRLPYDWPRGFMTNNPVPHVEPLVTLN